MRPKDVFYKRVETPDYELRRKVLFLNHFHTLKMSNGKLVRIPSEF